MRDHGCPHKLRAEVPPLRNDLLQGGSEGGRQAAALSPIAASKRVLAQASCRMPQFRFGLVLPFDNGDQTAADEKHRGRGECRVHDRCDHQIPGDDKHPTRSFESEVATHDPKNIDEGDCGQHCLQQSDGEVNGRVCRHPCIFGNPVLRVLVVARNEVKLAVAAVREPERDQVLA